MVKIGVGKKIWTYLGYLLLVPSILFNLYQFNRNNEQKNTYRVEDVIDGDTIVTDKLQKIRLADVEAPESDRCGGTEAKQLLQDLILGKNISLEITAYDIYNRPLAYAFTDNQLVNESLASSGWAVYLGSGKGENREKVKTAAAKAREEKRGVYEKCVQSQNPNNPKCSVKGIIGRPGINYGKKIYRFQGCRDYSWIDVSLYRGDQWFCSEKEAMEAGFVKSKNCFDKNF